jgi:hypothetical protein
MSEPEFFSVQHTAFILYTSAQLHMTQNFYTATKMHCIKKWHNTYIQVYTR